MYSFSIKVRAATGVVYVHTLKTRVRTGDGTSCGVGFESMYT